LQPDKAGSASAFRAFPLRSPAVAHMQDNLESLCDLVQIRAMKHHIPFARLWKRVFVAIRDGQLDFGFPDEFEHEYGGRNPPPPYVKHIREIQCVNALFAIQNGEDPWMGMWVRRMLVSATAFDTILFPLREKRRVGPKSLTTPVANFIQEKFPDGVPDAVTRKEIARLANPAIGKTVSEKTVSRAIKKLRSDGTD
jgi:hypothetical protein